MQSIGGSVLIHILLIVLRCKNDINYNEVDDYDEIDKLKLNNDKVDNKKSVRGKKKKEIVFGRGS